MHTRRVSARTAVLAVCFTLASGQAPAVADETSTPPVLGTGETKTDSSSAPGSARALSAEPLGAVGELVRLIASWMGSSTADVQNSSVTKTLGNLGRKSRTITPQTPVMVHQQQVRSTSWWVADDSTIRVEVTTNGCNLLRGWTDTTTDRVVFGVINGRSPEHPEGPCTDNIVFSTIDIPVQGGIGGRRISEGTIPREQLAD
ncbi:hypothetical protein ACFSSC_06165 [Corynebacterium mendelii]|uniref:Secreted protein n=1 Tax=Corynebacterium mendelii TaxID=2765362 RepID=A0A939E181_9CORY|nr:hypothetical protein [Corynebacterium mendelii]MBN9644564.1 hypothetical protein [Corynebacterium mendelii]